MMKIISTDAKTCKYCLVCQVDSDSFDRALASSRGMCVLELRGMA